MSAVGAHTVSYYSTDVAGNVESAHLASFTLGTDSVAPKAISGLKATANVDSGVTLAWAAPADNLGKAPISPVAAYDIRYSTSAITAANFSSAPKWTGSLTPGLPGAAESLVIPNLTKGTTYYFAIKSRDASNNWSLISNVVNAKPRDLIAPATITDLLSVAPSGAAQDSAAVLQWTAPSDNVGVSASDIRYTTAPIGDPSTFATSWTTVTAPKPLAAGTLTTLVVGKLIRGTTYHFAIRSKDAAGNYSPVSNAVVAVPIDLAPPKAISGLKASANLESAVTLSFAAPAEDLGKAMTTPATSYVVRYSTSPITAANFAAATPWTGSSLTPALPGTAQSLVVTGLTSGTTYYFAIESIDAVGNVSAISNVASARPRDWTPPSQVSDLASLTPVGVAQNAAAVLSWATPSDNVGVTGYELRYTTASSPDVSTFTSWTKVTAPAPLVAGTPVTFVVPRLAIGTTYTFAIRSKDAAGNWSAVSNRVTAVPLDLLAPKAVTTLKATAGTTALTLAWTAPSDNVAVSSYDIRYSTSPITAANFSSATQWTGSSSVTPKAAGTAQSATLSGLTTGAKYYVAIESSDAAGNFSAISNVASALVK